MVAAAVKRKHGNDFPFAVLQWEKFLASAPLSDDADEYVKDNPLYIPFRKEMFGIDPSDERYTHGRDDCAAKKDQCQQDAAAASKGLEEEVWRSLPCMSKSSAAAFERVKAVKQDDGMYSICFYFIHCTTFRLLHYISPSLSIYIVRVIIIIS